MTSKDRILAALHLQKPDRVPILEWSIHENVLKVLEPGTSQEDFMANHLDAIAVAQNMQETGCGGGAYIDEWGIVRKRLGQDYGIPFGFPLREEKDLLNHVPPDPRNENRLLLTKEVVRKYGRKKAVIFGLETVFTTAWSLVGLEAFLIALKTNPDFARKLLDRSFNYHYELAQSAMIAGVDAIMCGDDLAYNSGLLISKNDFERYLLPYYKAMIEEVHRRGCRFVKHTDGRIWEILGSLVEIGADGINPLEPTAGMDLGKVKRAYGESVCLIGNVDCGELLSRGNVRQVRAAVRRAIDAAAAGGGYIMSSSNVIHASVKPENYAAMLEEAANYGRYAA